MVSIGALTAAPAMAATDSTTSGTASTASTATRLPAEVQAQLKGAPAAVTHWVNGFEVKGEQVLSLVQSNYVWERTAKNSTTKSNTVIKPNSYPVGCGLFVTITRDVDDITSNNLTSCLKTAQEIQMYSGIALSAWWGWDTQVTDEDGLTDVSSLALDYVFNCGGSGTHNFQTATNGHVEINGSEAQASAYDEIDNQSCP
jgi:hypothetical protein